ncbi:MAG: AAA family ATPase [Betaproteobacteria bacterium]|nr:AAA family ATPase [Betaproteobacteria bacterium]
MKSLLSRLRGVERDIIQPPSDADFPYYESQGTEIAIFEAAYKKRLPVMLKGPAGCGKTRFLEYMAHRLGRPLVTVRCHEDLTAGDLIGSFLCEGEQTLWQDGPLTRAVKAGAICYLDDVAEAHTDSTAVIHSLTDHRRRLPLEKRGTVIEAHEDFMLVISYNPGLQGMGRDLRPATKQRFIGINFDFPREDIERKIVKTEVPELAADVIERLVAAGRKARTLKDHGLDEATSTRALVYAAAMMSVGVSPEEACRVAMINPVTDDPDLADALLEIVAGQFG